MRTVEQTIEQLADAVPHVLDSETPLAAEVRTLQARLVMLKELGPEIRQKLSHEVNRATSADWSYRAKAVAEDADFLAKGGDVATLSAERVLDGRGQLLRQLHAVEKAIVMVESRLNRARMELEQQCLAELGDLRRAMAEELIEGYEQLRNTLARVHNASQALHKKGYEWQHLRGTPFALADFDTALLRGGLNRPNLDWWLTNRRATFLVAKSKKMRK